MFRKNLAEKRVQIFLQFVPINFGMMLFLLIFLSSLAFAQNESSDNFDSPASAIVKGTLWAYNGQNKLPITLTARNMRTQERELRVFSPDTVNGEFFMFLLPDEKYEISVFAKGFRPYVIVVYVPSYTFLYEIHREISFEPIYLMDNQVGQKAIITNKKQEILSTYDSAHFKGYAAAKYRTLKQLIDHTMSQNDPSMLDSLDRVTISEATPSIPDTYETTQKPYNGEYETVFSVLEKVFEHGSWEYVDAIFAKQSTGRTYYEVRSSTTRLSAQRKALLTHFVWFQDDTRRLSRAEKDRLNELAFFLNQDTRLMIEIFGRTHSERTQDPEKRLKISRKRTKQVFRYLKKRVNNPEQFCYIVSGLSEELDDSQEKEENSSQKLLTTSAPRVELVISLE